MSNIAAIPTQQVVDTRYTQDVIPVLDTSKFEHMQRVATVMANTATLPDSLRFADPKNKKDPFEHDVLVATCFRIVNQAVRWGFDPFAVSDCAFIIHGRLGWEGKLVHAVIAAKTGINLNYRFFDDAKGQNMGVLVSGTLSGETEIRTIQGRVKDWHTGAKGPWASEGAWERQLRYRGAREWARAHSPHIMLGVYVDDELDGIASRDVPAGQRAQRMKDVTPPKMEIPDIPEVPEMPDTSEAEASQDGSEDDINASDFLKQIEARLKDGYSPSDIYETFGEMAERLSEDARGKFDRMLEAAA